MSGICESDGVLNTWLTFPLRTHRLLTHQQSLSMLPPLQHPSEPWLPYIVDEDQGGSFRVFGAISQLVMHQSIRGRATFCSAGQMLLVFVSMVCISMSRCILRNPLALSLIAQLVKNPPAMQETWVWSLGWEDPWRRERLPTPKFWSGEFHRLYSPWGRKELNTTERLALSLFQKWIYYFWLRRVFVVVRELLVVVSSVLGHRLQVLGLQ